MQYLKFGKIFVAAVLGLGLSACAELTNGLHSVNGTLAGINSGMGSASNSNVTSIPMPDKVTSQYEVRNLTLSQETVSQGKIVVERIVNTDTIAKRYISSEYTKEQKKKHQEDFFDYLERGKFKNVE